MVRPHDVVVSSHTLFGQGHVLDGAVAKVRREGRVRRIREEGIVVLDVGLEA